ncbi:MAG: Lrp/AsnC family transcriptional regulator [Nanoarchaeota archaeon]
MAKTSPTKTEQKLIAALRNGHHRPSEIARIHDIPRSSAFEMTNRLKSAGILTPAFLVDFEKVGFPVQMFLALKTTPGERSKLESFLKDRPEVNTLLKVNTMFDYHAEAFFRHYKDLQLFIEELETRHAITDRLMFNAVETIKKEQFLSQTEHWRCSHDP